MDVLRLTRNLFSVPSVLSMLAICSFCGCGGDPKPTTEQAKVTGSVTYDGTPVPRDSSVVFYSADHAATAAGKVDSLGKFQLSAAIPSIGVPAGRYSVMIRPPEPPAPSVSNTADYSKVMQSGGLKPVEPPKEIPKKFMALETSGLVFELKPGDNNFDLDLAKLAK